MIKDLEDKDHTKRKYSFIEYDENWTKIFEENKLKILNIFNNNNIKIEHIGSTSIKGMKAKPVIDILISVDNINIISPNIIKEFSDIGFKYKKDYIDKDTYIFFTSGDDNQKFEQIHICESDSQKEKQFLIMRDYLRSHPEKAKEYSEIKEKNYNLYPEDYPAYREAKYYYLKDLEKEAYDWWNKNQNKNS